MIFRGLSRIIINAYYHPPISQIYPSIFHTQNASYFCTNAYHPLIKKLQSMRKQKDIDELLVQMTNLNEFNQKQGLKIIIQKIQGGIFPQGYIVDPMFITHIKKHPELYVEALLFRVSSQFSQLSNFINTNHQEGKKVVVKDINECFVKIFDNLKKIPRNQALDLQIVSYKMFAYYHLQYLLLLVQGPKLKEVLTKGVDFYKNILVKIESKMKLVEQQIHLLTKSKESKQKDEQQINEQILLLQHELFILIESNSQILLETMIGLNFLTDKRLYVETRKRLRKGKQDDIQFQFHSGLFQIIPDFNKGLALYSKVQNKQESILYPKLKKMYLELSHAQKMEEGKDNEGLKVKQEQDFKNKLFMLSDQLGSNISLLRRDHQEYESIIGEFCIIMLSIKIEVTDLEIDNGELKQIMLESIKQILKNINQETLRKDISIKLSLVVEQSLGINLEEQFGKVSRRFRTKRS